jgi:hypothetical protein
MCLGWNGTVESAVPAETPDLKPVLNSSFINSTNSTFYKQERCSENRRYEFMPGPPSSFSRRPSGMAGC